MGVAFEILLVPVVLAITLVAIAVWTHFSLITLLLGVAVVSLLLVGMVNLVRFEWNAEHEGENAEDEPNRMPVATAVAASAEGAAAPHAGGGDRANLDLVDECGWESFPASDPPGWTSGVAHSAAEPHHGAG